jgi:hypothetical protein
MGTMHHHALIVTTWDAKLAVKAHTVASGASPHTTPLVKSTVNVQYSFAVLPDGSKEGWPESAVGDAARQSIIDWITAQAYEDGSNAVKWAEVSFGELAPTFRHNGTPQTPPGIPTGQAQIQENSMTRQDELRAMVADLDGETLFIDDDGDACLAPSGRDMNLVALPGRDDDGGPLRPDAWAAMVSRFNAFPIIAIELADALDREAGEQQ